MPTTKSSSSKPSKKERMAKLRQIADTMEHRMKGIYLTEETKAELKVCLQQFFAKDDDAFLTLVTRLRAFNVYTKAEFKPQLQEWKKLGVKCEDFNFHERELDGQKFFFFVAQPPDLADAPMCPVALALGYMVSGFTYIIKDKATFDEVKAALA